MPVLPTGNDLKRLPLRGLIAYSARSALRVQPLFWVDEEHPEAQECCAAVDNAIRMALDFADGKEIAPDKAADIEDAAARAVVVACDEKSSDRRAAFSSNAAYAAINAVTAAIASRSAGSRRSNDAMRAVMASVTTVDSAVAADPAIRHAVISDFKRLSRMSLGSFPNFGKPVGPTGKGVLGPVNPSRQKTQPLPKPEAEASDDLSKELQETKPLREALQADRADPEEQRRLVADPESKLATERAELERLREQIVECANKIKIEREQLQLECDRLTLERVSLERAQSDFSEQQAAFDEDRRQFEANNAAAQFFS
jgi:hypothetical protein